ncbi:MAG: hypothetical protein EXQ94_13305 [Alphaproteobacteria bacterium]|nr:hypothetical protein [Alphaproteobacteria bacterium]
MPEPLAERQTTNLVRELLRDDRLLTPRTIAGAGFAVFLLLFGLEFLDPDTKTIGEIVRDALALAVAVGVTTAIAIVVSRRLHHQESRLADLEVDLDKARAEGGPGAIRCGPISRRWLRRRSNSSACGTSAMPSRTSGSCC